MQLHTDKQVIHRLLLTWFCLAVSFLLIANCATAPWKGGGKRPKKINYNHRNAVILFLNEGLRLHYAGKYKQSNFNLEKAEAKMEELYTKSLTRSAASMMINDYTIPYRGEDFENVMTNLFMGLNYTLSGKGENALVEARKVDIKLNVINDRYKPEKKNVYAEDAFVRFIMGLLYESENETNDAFISYRKAEGIYEAYQNGYGVSAPGILLTKLVNSTKAMLFEDELKYYRDKYPHIKPPALPEPDKSCEVFFFHYNGLCPRKVENAFTVRLPDGYLLRIAVPRFRSRPYSIKKCEIVLSSKEGANVYRTRTEIAEDIGAIAIQNLENRMARIRTKAIARATTKYLATMAAGMVVKDRKGRDWSWVVRSIMNIFTVLTERADLRSCDMLPDRIDIGHLNVPPGDYSVAVNTMNAGGKVIGHIDLADIQIKAGEKRFVSFRTIK